MVRYEDWKYIMKIGAVTDSLSHFPFEELLDTLADLGVAGIELNTGNW